MILAPKQIQNFILNNTVLIQHLFLFGSINPNRLFILCYQQTDKPVNIGSCKVFIFYILSTLELKKKGSNDDNYCIYLKLNHLGNYFLIHSGNVCTSERREELPLGTLLIRPTDPWNEWVGHFKYRR